MRFPWCRHCPSATPDWNCGRKRGTLCPWAEWSDGVVYNLGTRASGGMANGYLAVDMRDGKTIPCWLKAHICRNEQDAQYIQRSFLYECELLDYLKDRGYVSAPQVVRRVELDDGPDGQRRVWYLMTEAEGEDWGSMQFQDERALHKGLYELAKALAELHKRGVGHFDLKPGEILRGKKRQGNIKCDVRTGQVMLIDFGTAIGPEWWQMADAEHHTNPLRKTLVGSKPWVSPEQEKLPIGQLTRHSDVYVYGLLFCKAILDREVAADEPRDRLAAELLQQVPQDLAELVAQQALAVEPARRAGALEELLVAMQAAGWHQGLRGPRRLSKLRKSQCAECGRELVDGKCPACNGQKKIWRDWKTWAVAIIGIVVIGFWAYWEEHQVSNPSPSSIISSPTPSSSLVAPPPHRPTEVHTNQFVVGSDVDINDVVKSGEVCLDQPPLSEGEGTFLRGENAKDGAEFDSDVHMNASKTRGPRVELKSPPSSPPPLANKDAAPPLPRPLEAYTNWFVIGDKVYTNYVVKGGETCPLPAPPPSPEGEGAFLRWEDVEDGTGFGPDVSVNASKTWVARFEPRPPPPSSHSPTSKDVAPPPSQPIYAYTNRFMVGDKVYTNYVVKGGEKCPLPTPPPSSEGEGAFLRWENVEDGMDFDPDAPVNTSETWVARFELKPPLAPPLSLTNKVVPPPSKPNAIHLVFTGRDGWRAEQDVQIGTKLGTGVIPVAPNLLDVGLGFSHWSAKEKQSERYDFGLVATDMPREFVAIYTNLPMRIEYVVDGQVVHRGDWYVGGEIPSMSNPKKEGFKFKGWLDGQGRPWAPVRYKGYYVPVIRLTAQFEKVGAWPSLTVVVESKGADLTNAATVRVVELPSRECVYTRSIECVGRKDTSIVIKADEYRELAPDAQTLAATISDVQGKQVGSTVLLKLNRDDQKVTVPVFWTEEELKKADGLCSDLHRVYEAHLGVGAKNPPSRAKGRIQEELDRAGPPFKGMGYDVICKLYANLDDPELTRDELEALEEHWP